MAFYHCNQVLRLLGSQWHYLVGRFTWQGYSITHVLCDQIPMYSRIQRRVKDLVDGMKRAGGQSLLEFTGIEGLHFLSGQSLHGHRAERGENMVVEGSSIPQLAAQAEFGCMHFFKPLFQKICKLLFWTRRQHSSLLLIEHVVQRYCCLALGGKVALPGLTILQDELRHPWFPFAVLTLEHGAGSMRARPALPAPFGLLFFVGVLFVGHDVTSLDVKMTLSTGSS